MVLQAIEDFAEACAQYERALTITETIRGPNHPNVGVRLFNLARILKDLGDLQAPDRLWNGPLQLMRPPTVSTILRWRLTLPRWAGAT